MLADSHLIAAAHQNHRLICELCRAPSLRIRTQVCSNECPAIVCEDCLVHYARSRSLLAACPTCAPKHPMALSSWSHLLDNVTYAELFEELVTSIKKKMNIKCPQCHHHTSIMPTYVSSSMVVLREEMRALLQAFCHEYAQQRVSLKEFYDSVLVLHSGNVEIIHEALKYIPDEYHRLILYQHHLAQHPKLHLSCCGCVVCFHCHQSSCKCALSPRQRFPLMISIVLFTTVFRNSS